MKKEAESETQISVVRGVRFAQTRAAKDVVSPYDPTTLLYTFIHDTQEHQIVVVFAPKRVCSVFLRREPPCSCRCSTAKYRGYPAQVPECCVSRIKKGGEDSEELEFGL